MQQARTGATASILHIAGMVLVVVAFLVTVMTAVAQQETLGRMAHEELGLGYSSAFALLRTLDARQRELPALRREERELEKQAARAQTAFRIARNRLDAVWQNLQAVAQRLARARVCEFTSPASDDLNSRLGLWNEVRECANAGPLAPTAAASVREALTGSGNVERAVEALTSAHEALTSADEQLELTRRRILAASSLSEDELKARRSFSELNVLREYWMLGGGLLVAFPPPMLQILLAFVSGAFGALLVTLVLIVYPNTSFSLSAGQQTWARIFLGGLIAMCVYIVLLGGTAVLGSSVGIAPAGANYMAFCAIGILAGMFSDRVAYWLSDKADAFFKRQPQPEEAETP
jgi:hypothetical protein